MLKHNLQRSLRPLTRTHENMVELGRVDELSIANADDAGCKLTHHGFTMRGEGDIGSSGVLPEMDHSVSP